MYVREYPYTPAGTEPSGTPITTSFTYNASKPDVLSQIDNQTVGFNANGGLSYYKRNYHWQNGKLKRFVRGSTMQPASVYEECEYQYNAYGQRISKTYTYDPNTSVSDDASYNYTKTYDYDHNGRLIREKIVQKHILEVTSTREFVYLYDESGMVGFTYSVNGATPTSYYYQRNLLGDVIGIYTASGTKVVEYAYDAWGNCTIAYSSNDTLANDNPIRYRGYYFDQETGWYFLNARYYSPEWRRFISPDDTAYLNPENVNGCNLYCYCGNNPVMFMDPMGNMSFSVDDASNILGVAILATIVIMWALTSITQNSDEKHVSNVDFGYDFLGFSHNTPTVNDSGLSIIGIDFSVCTLYMYFNNDKSRFLYLSLGNASAFLGKLKVNSKETNLFAGGKLALSLLEIGYDGFQVDLALSFVGVGYGMLKKAGQWSCFQDIPILPGLEWSIDLVSVIKSFFGIKE